MKAHLVAMFLLPLIDIFDRWKARHTELMGPGGAYTTTNRFGWHYYEWEGRGGFSVKVFHLNVPWVRSWRRSSRVANFQLGYVEGWHRLMLLHIKVSGKLPNGPGSQWQREWLPCPDCRQSLEMEDLLK